MKLKQYEKAEKVLQQALDHEPGRNISNLHKKHRISTIGCVFCMIPRNKRVPCKTQETIE